MSSFLLEFVARAIQLALFVMDVLNGIANLLDFGRLVATGRCAQTPAIRIPPEPKAISPAAERALAEAEARRRAREARGEDRTDALP